MLNENLKLSLDSADQISNVQKNHEYAGINPNCTILFVLVYFVHSLMVSLLNPFFLKKKVRGAYSPSSRNCLVYNWNPNLITRLFRFLGFIIETHKKIDYIPENIDWLWVSVPNSNLKIEKNLLQILVCNDVAAVVEVQIRSSSHIKKRALVQAQHRTIKFDHI